MEQESILLSIKKALSLAEEIKDFDPEIIMFINGAFSYLAELGVGPPEGFQITGEDETWNEVVDSARFNDVKTLIYLRVRLVFDPPTVTVLEKAFTEQLRELEWRINSKREEDQWTEPRQLTLSIITESNP